MRPGPGMLSLAVMIPLMISAPSGIQARAADTIINPPPTAQDWADLAKLPDWNGVWIPKISDQGAQITSNPTPWTPKRSKM